MAALEQLAGLVEIIDDLGPVSRRALRAKINRAARSTRAEPALGVAAEGG
jgi:hypothetical protein